MHNNEGIDIFYSHSWEIFEIYKIQSIFQAYRNQVSGATNLAEAGNSRYRGTTMLTKLPIAQGTQAMYKVHLYDLKYNRR